jgi:hypothetical protein
LNSDKIWTIWKKIVKIGKIWKNPKLNCEMIWKIWKKPKWNIDKIWTIWKKGKLNSENI